MNEMTLGQVRDELRQYEKDFRLPDTLPLSIYRAKAMADAIDAEIKRRDALQDEQFLHAIVSITDILDGKDTGAGVCNEPWQSVRMRLIELVKRQASAQGEAVEWQYQGRDGVWRAFVNDEHRMNTELEGSWPIRALYTTPPASGVPDIDLMVRRFLSWRLPDNFCPDAGISFEKPRNHHWWPVGTNLFTAEQAEQMVQHMLAASPQPDAKDINYES